MSTLKIPYIVLSVLMVTHLYSQFVFASKSAKKNQPQSPTAMLSFYFDYEGEQAFVLKERLIKGKKEYFLSFMRGKQTYGTILISRPQFVKYKNSLEENFNIVSTKRAEASVDSCHKRVAFRHRMNVQPVVHCWEQLPESVQAGMKSLASGMNKKVYGTANNDLI